LAALVLGRGVTLEQKMDAAPKSQPGKPVTATGKRRALRQALDETAKKKAKAALDRLLRAREAPAPAPKSQRQATIFAEDEFQTGRRLLLQGNIAEARAKFEKAVELSPGTELYALHAQFAASRGPTGFADHEATKKLATRLVREDAECAFGYYVLAYLALEQHAAASAKKLFRRAHEIDPELIDAARQMRLLDIRADAEAPSVATPYHAIVPTLLRSEPPDGAPKKTRTTVFLAVALAVVL